MEGNEKKDWGNFGWKLPVEKNEERVGNGDEAVAGLGDGWGDWRGNLMGLCSVP